MPALAINNVWTLDKSYTLIVIFGTITSKTGKLK